MRRWPSLALLAAAAASPAPLAAQAYQCRLPQTARVPAITPEAPPRATPVTGYTLALSWSPEFCKPRKGEARHAFQCAGENGRFGFVVHGLWPQGTRGWPQWCPTQNRLTPAELRRNLCMMPSPRLAARQWAKHGACMTRRPETYFGVTRVLWESLRLPDYDRLSREDALTAGRIRTAFLEANPGWPRGAVGVKLNERGWLQELRLCYSRRFRPVRCDPARFGVRDGARAKIWRGL
ncbi:MAG: ribonuclease T [Erythrobacter sp.]|jgi:ribonuclease T2|nr:ribonuclease T [Erythrobacter sp.]